MAFSDSNRGIRLPSNYEDRELLDTWGNIDSEDFYLAAKDIPVDPSIDRFLELVGEGYGSRAAQARPR